ncbi:unnamed protein product [Timema podura]|uniref:Uncharacterized protein n=1 Tax=Timema podura TaxID=61482 RepID=A0ABN7NI60_TIMPD|nr:unnamed protein product [Timema podura]
MFIIKTADGVGITSSVEMSRCSLKYLLALNVALTVTHLLIGVSSEKEDPNQSHNVPSANLQHLCPRGLRLWIPDSPEIQFVGFHVSINSPLIGASPSEFNTDLGRPTGGKWTFDIPDIYLQKGDSVFYWLHLVVGNHSRLKTDLTWNVPGTDTGYSNFQCTESVTVTTKSPVCSGQLLFQDDFNSLNLNSWQHEITASGGRHSEFQMFVNNRSNSFVRDGVLHIRPTLTKDVLGENFLFNGVLDLRGSSLPGERCTNPSNNGCYKRALGGQILNPVLSAQLQTSQSFSFQYGVVKVKAKMPRGDWLWPGIVASRGQVLSLAMVMYCRWLWSGILPGVTRYYCRVWPGIVAGCGQVILLAVAKYFSGCGQVSLPGVTRYYCRVWPGIVADFGQVSLSGVARYHCWLWPAITLLPKHSAYGGWPSSGQITVGESRGNARYMLGGDPLGVQRVEMALNFGLQELIQDHQGLIKKYANSEEGWDTNFHEYQVDWTRVSSSLLHTPFGHLSLLGLPLDLLAPLPPPPISLSNIFFGIF